VHVWALANGPLHKLAQTMRHGAARSARIDIYSRRPGLRREESTGSLHAK
jgi:hypothetical protein